MTPARLSLDSVAEPHGSDACWPLVANYRVDAITEGDSSSSLLLCIVHVPHNEQSADN